MKANILYGGEVYAVKVAKSGDGYEATVNGRSKPFKIHARTEGAILIELDGERLSINVCAEKNRRYLAVDGEYYAVELVRGALSSKTAVEGRGDSVTSPMPGLLVKVMVKPGDKVLAGTTLAVVEAMKMQNELRAPRDGVVKKINFAAGGQIDAFVPIVELEK